ncbi:MAG: carboxymuconolactone decarboxylase family protein [Maricaulaceae bacterium]
MSNFKNAPDLQGFPDIVMRDQDRFGPYMMMAQNLMRGPSELSEGERESLAAFVSAINACEFCIGAHAAVAEAFNVDASRIQALLEDPELSELETRARPIYLLARKLTLDPSRVAAEDIEAVTAQGWSERTAEDVVAITAFFNAANRIADGFGVKGDDAYFKALAGMVGPNGAYFQAA